MNIKKRKLLFIVNDHNYFLSHRLPIAIAAFQAGYEVHVATGTYFSSLPTYQESFFYHYIPLSRSGKQIFTEFKSFIAMYQLMQRIQPSIVHLVTIKPVIYGAIAARCARVPAVAAAIAGLGHVFVNHNWKARIFRYYISRLYKFAFQHVNLKIIFQNADDKNTLLLSKAFQEKQAILVRGSGVDLTQYSSTVEPDTSRFVVIMAARLLRDKGVIEYVEAARLLKARGIDARFCLAGLPDPGNPSSIQPSQLEAWHNKKYIEYLGYCANIPVLFAKSHLIVLPSYREGLPKVLIEAAACGRAIVTTDAPGCREAIIPNQTGLLVKPGDVLALANAIHTLITNTALRQAMGAAGRKLAEQEFNINKIVHKHLQIYANLMQEIA